MRYGAGVAELAYARVSSEKQSLERQIHALTAAGIERERIYVDKKSGATTDRPGLRKLFEYARKGDRITVLTLDRLGRTVRDTLNLIHELDERGIALRNLADPITVDTTDPEDSMGRLAVLLLAMFAQMERTYSAERAAHARTVATAQGRRTGRPVTVDPDELERARWMRDQAGYSMAEIVKRTQIPRSSLYRHLPPRPEVALTAAGEGSMTTKHRQEGDQS